MVKTPTSRNPATTRGNQAPTSANSAETAADGTANAKRPRILGLDIARGLAILGMIYLHLGHPLWQTKVILSGLPAAQFAVIAGVTMMLIWTNAAARATTLQTIAKLAARGVLITLIGLALLPVGGEIQVVLVVLGATMLATAWVPPLPTGAKVTLLLIATAAATWRYAPLELPPRTHTSRGSRTSWPG